MFKNEKTKQGRKKVKNFCRVLLRKRKWNGKQNERWYRKIVILENEKVFERSFEIQLREGHD